MKIFLLKVFVVLAVVVVGISPSAEAHGKTSKQCQLIVDLYNDDVAAIKENLEYLHSNLSSKTDPKLKEEVGIIIKDMKQGKIDYSAMQGIKESLSTFKIPSHVDSWYKHSIDQIDSAKQRVDEWKSKNTSGTTCNQQECKDQYGCLLGESCTKNPLVVPACPTSKTSNK